jgi:SNW domain-containing protein 1
MATRGIRQTLEGALPKPINNEADEESGSAGGPQIKFIRGGKSEFKDGQMTIRVPDPIPPYGERQKRGWRPRAPEDFRNGGAFPECLVAQYPLDMGRRAGWRETDNSIARLNSEGKIDHTSILQQGLAIDDPRRAQGRIKASFKDLIPLRQRADAGEIVLDRPSEEEVQATKERTAKALQIIVSGTTAASNPKNVKGLNRDLPTFVRYTPSSNQMGQEKQRSDRILKIVPRFEDPLDPPKFKHKKIPRGPPSPPAPVLHSPPRKLTAEDQEAWRIPPAISNWKNPKGYTVPLDKRLAADGRGIRDNTISDKFSQFTEALYMADEHARQEVKQRAMMQQKLKEKEKMAQEEQLQILAKKAREERSAAQSGSRRDRSPKRSRSRSVSSSDSSDSDSEEEAARDREKARRERRKENEKELRQSRMGAERRIQMMAREQGRDISEKIALGLAKPTTSGESMYDSRLFNQSSGFAAGFNEDQPYDKPLFAAQDAISSIYRPKAREDDDAEDGGETYDKIAKVKRFEGFGGPDAEAREGPVQFEKDTGRPAGMAKGATALPKEDDPFDIGQMISDVKAGSGPGSGAGTKRYGLQDGEEGRTSKRARVEDDE